MKITQAHIKYYGTMIATFAVLLLSTNRIASALGVIEQTSLTNNDIYVDAWIGAAGLQVFEVLTGMGIADLISRKKWSGAVMFLLIAFMVILFFTNLGGNLLFAFANMAGIDGHKLVMKDIKSLDELKKYWIFWGSVPVPLMGVIGVTVMAIFRKDLPKKNAVTKINPDKFKELDDKINKLSNEVLEFKKLNIIEDNPVFRVTPDKTEKPELEIPPVPMEDKPEKQDGYFK